jgi:hypothetical protein
MAGGAGQSHSTSAARAAIDAAAIMQTSIFEQISDILHFQSGLAE